MRLRRLLLVALMVAVASVSGCTAFGGSGFQQVIRRAQKQVFPTLVFIKPIKSQLGTGELVRQQVFGSGVIISPDGLVVTNSHVVADTTQITCVLYNSEQVSADLVGHDPETDIALIRLKLPPGHAPLPAIRFADSTKIAEGDFVMAFGSPYGLTRSISFGIVSARARYIEPNPYNLMIQTDAAINPGNSGGPLVDERGRLIGINASKLAVGDNIGFAIPANTVRAVVEQLQTNGRVERSYIGVLLQPLRDYIRDSFVNYDRGVLVGGVVFPSPAANAGLKSGDLILSINGVEIKGVYLEDLPHIRNLVAQLPVNRPSQMLIMRAGEKLDITIQPTAKIQVQGEGLDLEAWNCSVQEIDKFRTPWMAYFAPAGVYVLGVRTGGNAQASGLAPGDIIKSVDGTAVQTIEGLKDIYERLDKLERGGRTALLEVERAGYTQYVVLNFNRDTRLGR